MRQRNDKETSEKSTTYVNNYKPTKTKSILHKKMLFKDAVVLLPHSSFHILSHRIAPDIISNGSNSTGQQGTSNGTPKYALLPYPLQRTTKMQLRWVRRSLR